jgi:hypothetical protein
MAGARAMANPPALVSPWKWQTPDAGGHILSITVTFDNTTHAITGVSSYRDPDCEFTQVLIGRGADGSPNSTLRTIDVPDGDFVLPANRIAALASRGLNTIDDILALQITAT